MTKDTEQVLGDLLNAIGLLIDGTTAACERLDPSGDYTAHIWNTLAEAQELNMPHLVD